VLTFDKWDLVARFDRQTGGPDTEQISQIWHSRRSEVLTRLRDAKRQFTCMSDFQFLETD
jgi:hypothetical protein